MSGGEKGQVSIIVPAYNAERFIQATIDSVRAQTYPHWELLIVVDANSKDRTRDIVAAAAQGDGRIHLLESPQAKGTTKNRNYALERAHGEYVAFVDADDLWKPMKLEKQIALLNQVRGDFSYTMMTRVSEDLSERGQPIKIPATVDYVGLLKNNVIGCSTVLVRRSKIGSHRFQEEGWEDLSLWLRLLKDGGVAHGLQESMTDYRVVKGSRSNNKKFSANLRWRTFRYVEGFGILKSSYYFSRYAISALAKYWRF